MANEPIFDAELIRRYDNNGPRYTSYPTAVSFTEDFDEPLYREISKRTNEELIPLPLSLYVHIPFCNTVCFYCACNKIITANKQHAVKYLQRLHKEIEWQGALFDRDRKVEQLHWGGGTPTYISIEQMRALMDALKNNFSLLNDDSGDYSIEIDPRTVTPDTIKDLRKLGFNRFSLGVQDIDENVQRAVNRLQSLDQTRAVVDACRANKAHSINLDLIYGLPLQTEASFAETLDLVINELRPDRLSVFNYAHMPQMFKTQRQIDTTQLPTAAEKLAILQQSIEQLSAAGYVHIGMDHFALPEDDLTVAQNEGRLQRNFQGYTTHRESDLVAMGVSAISNIGNSYSQNEKSLEAYMDFIDQGKLPITRGLELNEDDILRRTVIQHLCCHYRLDIDAVEKDFGISFNDYFSKELGKLQSFVNDNLIIISPQKIEITAKGRLLVRNVCQHL